MKKLIEMTKRFFTDEEGATAVEYAVILAAIIAVTVTAYQLIGTNADGTLNSVAGDVAPPAA